MKLSLIVPLFLMACSTHTASSPIASSHQPFLIYCTSKTMQANDIYKACFEAAKSMCGEDGWRNASDQVYLQPVIVEESPNHFHMSIVCK